MKFLRVGKGYRCLLSFAKGYVVNVDKKDFDTTFLNSVIAVRSGP